MTTNRFKIGNLIQRLTSTNKIGEVSARLAPKFSKAKSRLHHSKTLNQKSIDQQWNTLFSNTTLTNEDKKIIADDSTMNHIEAYSKNIENCIGTLKLPIGVAGPLRVNGLFAQGDYYIPLATTEATLVASYNRGSLLITKAGGSSALILNDCMTRSPGFVFKNLDEVSQFLFWAQNQFENFKNAAEATTRHGKLEDIRTTVEGNHVYINFDYFTGDASGQNMTTIATEAILNYIMEQSPVSPKYAFIEANLSGDKKASALSYLSARGKKVTAEVFIPRKLVELYLHTTPEVMVDYWRMAALGGVMSGTIGVQAHYANGLAALYLATGQDVACVSESSIGVTRLEITDNDELYASVTMPNIVVGTVGGGTKLPSQSIGLKLMGLLSEGNVLAFAEVCGATCLAGELSIMGAMCAGDFSKAHERLARG